VLVVVGMEEEMPVLKAVPAEEEALRMFGLEE
jgi:hypothetical protein